MIKVFVAALAASVFGTLAHQTQLANVPIGLALSFAAVAIAALEAKQMEYRFLFPCVFSLVIFLIAQNITRDLLIPADSLGIFWSYGSVAIAALVSLWPKLKV